MNIHREAARNHILSNIRHYDELSKNEFRTAQVRELAISSKAAWQNRLEIFDNEHMAAR